MLSASLHTAEVSDNGKHFGRHVISTIAQTCTCEEWQHISQPCGHALAFLTTQKNVNWEEYVDVCYSVEKFKAAYKREILALSDKSHWPEVDLSFNLGAPLGKRGAGRQRKLRIKGCLETGGKSSAKNDDKRKKMVRGPVTCKRCGEKGHRQASYKCPMNGTKKKRKRQPRKNNTKYSPEPCTPIMTINRDTLMEESPGMVTRRRLAMLLGHRSGTTGEAGGNLGGSTSGGADCTLGASTSGGAGYSLGGNSSTIPKKKKLTSKKMKKT